METVYACNANNTGTGGRSLDDTGLMGVDPLAIDPRKAANVYMLAGTKFASNGNSAILRSTDYGKTFTATDVTAQFHWG